MRHGRAKAARKTLQYFRRTTGLKPPYDILLDANMVVAMFQQKILPFKERMDRVLQTTGAEGPNHYCILQSAVDELQTIHDKLNSKNHPKADSFGEALKFIHFECTVFDHRKDEQRINRNEDAIGEDEGEGDNKAGNAATKEKQAPPSVQEDLLHHIENEEHPYVVATQDEGLLHTLRSMGTVPILRLANSSVLIIENPSKQSQRQAKGIEHKKWKHNLQDSERQLVSLARKEKRASKEKSSETGAPHHRNKNKAKGPNPLSCKRKQSAGDKNKESASKKRRLRAKAKAS